MTDSLLTQSGLTFFRFLYSCLLSLYDDAQRENLLMCAVVVTEKLFGSRQEVHTQLISLKAET